MKGLGTWNKRNPIVCQILKFISKYVKNRFFLKCQEALHSEVIMKGHLEALIASQNIVGFPGGKQL